VHRHIDWGTVVISSGSGRVHDVGHEQRRPVEDAPIPSRVSRGDTSARWAKLHCLGCFSAPLRATCLLAAHVPDFRRS
jgi:hypothetical protein